MQYLVKANDEWVHEIILPDDQALQPYVGTWVAMLSDSPFGLKPVSLIRNWNAALLVNYKGLALQCAELAHNLIAYVSQHPDNVLDYPKDLYAEMHSIPGLPILYDLLKIRNGEDRDKGFAYIYSFLTLGKKTVYGGTPDLEILALRKWISVEEKLQRLLLPDYVRDLRTILCDLLASSNGTERLDFNYRELLMPHHGNGAVAEKGCTTRFLKDRASTFTKGVVQLLSCEMEKLGKSVLDCLPTRLVITFTEVTKGVWKCIPKNIKSMRTITMEPAGNMMLQQGVLGALERVLSQSWARRFVQLKDQTHNQDAAREGSLSGHLDTIDLSNASDSVSFELVRRVFPASVWKWLYLTRSQVTKLPDGAEYRPAKFAPMGSAVCFPIQTMVYLSVVVLCYHRYLYGDDTPVTTDVLYGEAPLRTGRRNSVRELLRHINTGPEHTISNLATIRVYGDDIICDSRVTEKVIEMLTTLGFEVNTEKSFTGDTYFRESCGGHYLNGIDVTPYSFKPDATKTVFDGKLLVSLTDAANRALDLGLESVRAFLIEYASLRSHKGLGFNKKRRTLLFEETRGFRGEKPEWLEYEYRISPQSREAYGHTLETDPAVQRGLQVRAVVPLVRVVQGIRDENYAYLQWQSSRLSSLVGWWLHLPNGRETAGFDPDDHISSLPYRWVNVDGML